MEGKSPRLIIKGPRSSVALGFAEDSILGVGKSEGTSEDGRSVGPLAEVSSA